MPEKVTSVIAMSGRADKKSRGRDRTEPCRDPHPETLQWLKDYMQRTGKSYRDLSGPIGVSSTYLHWYVTKPAKVFNISELEKKLNLFRERLEERQRLGMDLPYIKTTASRVILSALAKTLKQGIISVITCDSGVGKTSSIREFAGRNRKTVFVVDCDVSYSPMVLFRNINLLFGDHQRCTLNTGLVRAVAYFQQHQNSILVVDDAHCLTNPRAINSLAALWNKTNIGIALIGQPELRTRILGPGNDKTAQVFSRIRQWLHVTAIRREDVAALAEAVSPGLPETVVDRMFHAASEYGHFRYALNLLRNGMDVAMAEGRDQATDEDVAKGLRLYGRR